MRYKRNTKQNKKLRGALSVRNMVIGYVMVEIIS